MTIWIATFNPQGLAKFKEAGLTAPGTSINFECPGELPAARAFVRAEIRQRFGLVMHDGDYSLYQPSFGSGEPLGMRRPPNADALEALKASIERTNR